MQIAFVCVHVSAREHCISIIVCAYVYFVIFVV